MRGLSTAFCLVAVLTAGCSRTGKAPQDSTGAAAADARGTGAGADAAGTPLATEDVAGCPRDTVARHEDPQSLVEEWVRRDAEGPMEPQPLADAWIANALSCIEAATSDHGEVISTYAVAPLEIGVDSARFLVRRQREYRVELDSARARLVRDQRQWTDMVEVVRLGRQGWRIAELSGGVHALPGFALSTFGSWSAADSAVLVDLAARARRATDGGA
jgi:hypothetical protein